MTEKNLVIADDDHDLVHAIRMRCENLGLRVHTAFDAMTALTVIHDHQPDLICLDVNMPRGNGLSVLEMLANDRGLCHTPVIILTGESDHDIIRRCHSLCAYYVEKCRDVWPRIEPILRELLLDPQPADPSTTNHLVEDQAVPTQPAEAAAATSPTPPEPPAALPREPWPGTVAAQASPSPAPPADRASLIEVVFEMLGTNSKLFDDDAPAGAEPFDSDGANEPPWVLCIDDDADYSHALKLRLERHGIAVVRAFEGLEGVRCAFTKPADVILLDYEMPNGQGDYVLARLKDNPVTRHIPVIMITGKKDRILERRVLSMGAVKFMYKPPNFSELLSELRRHIDVLPQPVPETTFSR